MFCDGVLHLRRINRLGVCAAAQPKHQEDQSADQNCGNCGSHNATSLLIDRNASNGGNSQVNGVRDFGGFVPHDGPCYGGAGGDGRINPHDGGQPDKSHADRSHSRQGTPQHHAQPQSNDENRDVIKFGADNRNAIVEDVRHGASQVERADHGANCQDDKDRAHDAAQALGNRMADQRAAKAVIISHAQGKQRCQGHAHLQRAFGYFLAKEAHRQQDQRHHHPQH